jgi:hypothetical protein
MIAHHKAALLAAKPRLEAVWRYEFTHCHCCRIWPSLFDGPVARCARRRPYLAPPRPGTADIIIVRQRRSPRPPELQRPPRPDFRKKESATAALARVRATSVVDAVTAGKFSKPKNRARPESDAPLGAAPAKG